MSTSAQKSTVLVVNNSPKERALLENILMAEYHVVLASNLLEADDFLQQSDMKIALVVLEISLLEANEFVMLALLRDGHFGVRIPSVIFSAQSPPQSIKVVYGYGASDYIYCPFNPEIMLQRLAKLIAICNRQNQLEKLVEMQVREAEHNNTMMIDILSTIVEFRNNERGLHVLRIRIITQVLLEKVRQKLPQYGLTVNTMRLISNAAALHDIGKVDIPQHILDKPGKYTVEEFEIIKTHPIIGETMLNSMQIGKNEPLVGYAREICRWHHERWKGEGYPDGLKGDEIPIAAQVVSLADAYDALVSERSYKASFSHEEAVRMILNGECGSFNPLMLECFSETSDDLVKAIDRSRRREGSIQGFELLHEPPHAFFPQMSGISDRTLFLLEEERAKSQFMAALSNEVLFEYDYETDLFGCSERAIIELGIPTNWPNATKRISEFEILNCEWAKEVFRVAEQTTVAEPKAEFRANIRCADGVGRWFELKLRTFWDNTSEPKLSSFIGKMENIHKQVMEKEKFRLMTQLDPLTGLYNTAMARKLVAESLAENSLLTSALLIVDIDYFNSTSDHHGHLYGDMILQRTAAIIKQNIRQNDVAMRVDGDAFVIYLCDVKSSGDVLKHCKRLNCLLSKQLDLDKLTASIGVAIYPTDGADYDELFLCANQAMHVSKHSGKNHSSLYTRKKEVEPE